MFSPPRHSRGDPLRHEHFNDQNEEILRLGRGLDADNLPDEPIYLRLTSAADVDGGYEWEEVYHSDVHSWLVSGLVGTAASDDLAYEMNLSVALEAGETVYRAWRAPTTRRWIFDGRAGSSGGTTGGGPGTARCDCPGDPDDYTVEVECGDCGAYYAGGAQMPTFWFLEIMTASTSPYAYSYAYCDTIACEQLEGMRIKLENQPVPYDPYESASCTWTGRGGLCVDAELAIDGDDWRITLMDRTGCVLGVYRKPIDEFDCCGINDGWVADPDSDCDLTLRLSPDPCACCGGGIECPPDGEPVCKGTDCCLESCACTLVVTVGSLATPPAVPCDQFGDPCYDAEGNDCPHPVGDPLRLTCFASGTDPTEACGGMNGVYAFQWVGDCTWRFKGVPGGGSVVVEAELTLAGRVWRLRLDGPDGQVAVFELTDWECEDLVELPFDEGASSCPILGDTPDASFTLCVTVN